jgi:hypothetical protein
MSDHAQQLHARLTTLVRVPEGLRMLDEPCGPVKLPPLWYYDDFNISPDAALAILRDAARRECDEHAITIETDEDDDGEWFVIHDKVNPDFAEDADDYESALIAGLDWIIEQEADNGK